MLRDVYQGAIPPNLTDKKLIEKAAEGDRLAELYLRAPAKQRGNILVEVVARQYVNKRSRSMEDDVEDILKENSW